MTKMPKELEKNFFKMIDDQWMLVTAKKPDGTYNMMTASWGGTGILWNKCVSFIFIRENRFTKEFLDESDSYTLTFFDESMRPALDELGAKSGRDLDKMNYPGLTPVEKDGAVWFEEATFTMVCKKLYKNFMPPESILCPTVLPEMYPGGNYHFVYVGEIVECIEK